ncbi:pregnancy zone protein-like isoform X2 [Mya arenaria]|uniref:pregnancy zone protein-like isoform X2 n=1 Tax=Mya arenaria TaxID=6604 RepID=UPI0022E0DA55|nr:pregnancy zone protein-like isoform X2 [Mya arenaria]
MRHLGPCRLLLLLLAVGWTFCESDVKFVFSMGAVMRQGGTNQMCLLLENLASSYEGQDRNVAINMDMNVSYGEEIDFPDFAMDMPIDDSVEIQDRMYFCQKFDAPKEGRSYIATVNITLNNGNSQELFGMSQTVVVVAPSPSITLIQTDKPIYKPGETVRVRVVTMDTELVPNRFFYPEITIETPDGLRVMQWNDIQTESGLVTLEMPLSSDPVLGDWNIKVVSEDKTKASEEQTFKVDEYVLPKFEVTVTPPSYLLPTNKKVSGTVCAKYTYGKNVQGTLRLEACFRSWYWIRPKSDELRPCAVIIADIDGCYEFHIDADELRLGESRFSSYGRLTLQANVTEDGTGVELYGESDGPSMSMNVLTLAIEDDSDGFFKPGFPYRGRVVVTNPDGTPAPGELIQVTLQNRGWKEDYYWQANFTSDVNGIVHFAISELNDAGGEYYLEAEAVVYSDDWRYTSDTYFYRTWTSGAYKTLSQWYSPSNSFIFIPEVTETTPCDGTSEIDVYYTAMEGEDYRFTVTVLSNKMWLSTEEIAQTFDGTSAIIAGLKPSEILKKYKTEQTEYYPLPPLPDIYYDGQEDSSDSLDDVGAENMPIENTTMVHEVPVVEETIVPEVAHTLGESEQPMPEKKAIGHFKLRLPVSDEMTPEATVLLYYMRSDYEIVAATTTIKVQKCFRNKVQMGFNKAEARPGDEVEYLLQAAPGSLCSVGMVDKSVTLLAGDNHLTPDEVLKRVNEAKRVYAHTFYYDEDGAYCDKYFQNHSPTQSHPDERWYSSSPVGNDASTAFRDARVWVASNGVLKSRPCKKYAPVAYDTLDYRMPVAMMSGPSGERTAEKSIDNSEHSSTTQPERIRSLFPETWLWELFSVGDTGTMAKQTVMPDTITEWQGNALCSHPSSGVGVSPLTSITGFQPFFASMTLPYSAVRGETLPVTVTVFNYLEECVAMEVTLREADGFEFTGASGNSRHFCLCGGDSESTKFYIIPTIIGEIDLTATAVSVADQMLCTNVNLNTDYVGVSDGVQKQLLIEAEGQPKEETSSAYMCAKDGVSDVELVEPQFPELLVPDSTRATVAIVGDIMGPTLSNLQNLLKMPYGCGEQNMASWAPNIFVLQYLDATRRSSPEITDKATGYMRIGYQRQLKYRHNDNAYSIWGENQYGNETGSLWLTAFVVKSMALSAKYVTIDEDDVNKSGLWILSHQQEDGCFPKVGKTFSSYLKGGLDGDEVTGLTAFTLVALLEGGFSRSNQSAIDKGFSCIGAMDLQAVDTYTLSVIAYAYSLYNPSDDRTTAVLAELDKRKLTRSGQTHWERTPEADKENEDDAGWWYYAAPSAEVEMTAYVLLALLETKTSVDEMAPIVQWISRQRNAYGGFSSTQDTVVALQALAKFGAVSFSGEQDLQIDVRQDRQAYNFRVTADNNLVYQSTDLLNTEPVEISVSGSGCVLAQVNLKYNVYRTEDTGPAFSVEVLVYRSRTQKNNCAMRTLEVCASYLKSGVSNMAIAEIKMPTGWVPVTSTLDQLVGTGRIQKYEIDENFVELYFDEFTSKKSCVDFEVEQEIRMSPLPARVQVYDYYETRYSVTVDYSIATTCGTKQEIPLDNEGIDCSVMQCRVTEEFSRGCPSCPDTELSMEEVQKLHCESYAIYKAIVGRSGEYPIKIKADLRPKEKKSMDDFVGYRLGADCSCPILESTEARAIIFRSKGSTENDRENLDFNFADTILLLNSKTERTVRKLASRNNICGKLDRLRRSKSASSERKLNRLFQKLGF